MAVVSRSVTGRPLVNAEPAHGPVLLLRAPISFWGGVEPASGCISDPRHPDHGAAVAGTVLAVPATIGSSSSSAVMLELLRGGNAPAALLLGEIDAILTLGVIVAREMGYPVIPVLHLEAGAFSHIPATGEAQVRGGAVTFV